MKGTTFVGFIRKQTKTNATTFTDAEIVSYANVVKDELAAEIASNVDEKYFEIELTRDLEAGVRDYTFPNDMLVHMTFAQVSFDGEAWHPMREADLSHLTDTAILTESYITDLYAMKKPEFYISGRSLKILSNDSIVNVSGGLKILAEIYPEELTTGDLSSGNDLSVPSSNITHRLPRQVHLHWATKVVILYKQGKEKPIPLTQQEQRIDIDLQGAMTKLAPRNTDRSFVASVPQDDGQDY